MVKRSSKVEVCSQHNSELDEVFELFINMGYTVKEAAQEMEVSYLTLKTWAWSEGASFVKDTSKARYLPHYVEFEGERYTITGLAKKLGMSRHTLSNRLKNGWDLMDAITTPVKEGNYKPRSGRDKSIEGIDLGRLWLRGKL